MKIEQNTEFQPITIVLTSKQEAETFWELVRWDGVSNISTSANNLGVALSDWFSNQAKL